jgi:hypothetical protein
MGGKPLAAGAIRDAQLAIRPQYTLLRARLEVGEAVVMAHYGQLWVLPRPFWVVSHNIIGFQVIAVRHVATRLWLIMANYG